MVDRAIVAFTICPVCRPFLWGDFKFTFAHVGLNLFPHMTDLFSTTFFFFFFFCSLYAFPPKGALGYEADR